MISAQSKSGNQVLQCQAVFWSLDFLFRNSVIKTLLACLAVLAGFFVSLSALGQSGGGANGAVASVVGQNLTQKVGGQKAPKQEPEHEPAVLQQIQPQIEANEDKSVDDDSQEMSGILPEGEAQLRVRISVPHKVNPDSTITLYPYPVRPPKIVTIFAKIDESPKMIRAQLLNLGYAQRSSDSRLFPIGGWRWKYIINAALAKSGTRAPTNIVTMYPWTRKMVPYVQPEIRRINQIEEERKARYRAAQKDFEENGVDIENEALHKGLAPVEIKLIKGRAISMSGTAVVPPGTWYVVATHKTPNLKFYWQIPVTVSAGDRQTVQLTQTNALVIQGDW